MPTRRVQVGPDAKDRLIIRQRACSVRVEMRLAGRPDPVWFELTVRPEATLASSFAKAAWSMASGVALGGGGAEIFVRMVDLFRHELVGRRQWSRDGMVPYEKRLIRALKPVARALARAASPRSREAALRFGTHARMWLYARFLADKTGRLVQASRVSPGVLLFSHALSEHGQPEVAERLLAGIVAGRRLDGLIDEALVAWERHGLMTAQDGGAFSHYAGFDDAGRALLRHRQRWLIRHAAATVPSLLVWLPPPVEYAPEDVPRTARANARWFRRMKRQAFYPVAMEDLALSVGLSSFVSARGAQLEAELGPSERWVRRLWEIVRRERWPLSRASSAKPVIQRMTDELRPSEPAPAEDWDALVHDLEDVFGPELWEEAAEDAAPAVSRDEPFPEPPVPESMHHGLRFVPLRTGAELEAESAEMHHCVRLYRWRAYQGETVFYALQGPAGRATLELARCDDGWYVGQFRGRRNQTPTPEVQVAFRSFVSEARQQLEARGLRLHDAMPSVVAGPGARFPLDAFRSPTPLPPGSVEPHDGGLDPDLPF